MTGRRTPLLVVLAATLMGGMVGCGGSDDEGGGEYGARDVCQQFVEDQLKSPGSADFSDESATKSDDGSWTVTGNVDSENSFGASIRNSYTCTVRYSTSSEKWTLENMESTGN